MNNLDLATLQAQLKVAEKCHRQQADKVTKMGHQSMAQIDKIAKLENELAQERKKLDRMETEYNSEHSRLKDIEFTIRDTKNDIEIAKEIG